MSYRSCLSYPSYLRSFAVRRLACASASAVPDHHFRRPRTAVSGRYASASGVQLYEVGDLSPVVGDDAVLARPQIVADAAPQYRRLGRRELRSLFDAGNAEEPVDFPRRDRRAKLVEGVRPLVFARARHQHRARRRERDEKVLIPRQLTFVVLVTVELGHEPVRELVDYRPDRLALLVSRDRRAAAPGVVAHHPGDARVVRRRPQRGLAEARVPVQPDPLGIISKLVPESVLKMYEKK